MPLAIFDLDNTIIAGDSDHLWGNFLCEIGAVNINEHRKKNNYYLQQYNLGKLNISEYCEFAIEPLSRFDMQELELMREQFINKKIKPVYLEKAQKLINKHKKQGDTILVITATNRFVAENIIKLYQIKNLLAIELEISAGRYTGKITGIPTYSNGKIDNLILWSKNNNKTLKGASFYSDSHNDIPLLDFIDKPIAVDPDEKLYLYAKKNNWNIIYLR